LCIVYEAIVVYGYSGFSKEKKGLLTEVVSRAAMEVETRVHNILVITGELVPSASVYRDDVRTYVS
jgi:hypothetical protein